MIFLINANHLENKQTKKAKFLDIENRIVFATAG